MAQESVYITGLGMVTPLGHDAPTTWQNIVAGKSGAGPISQFDARTWPVSIAHEVKDFALTPGAVLPERSPLLNRASEFGLQAAWEALRDAGLLPTHSARAPHLVSANIDPERTGVIMGTGIGAWAPAEVLALLKRYELQPEFAGVSSYLERNKPQHSVIARHHPASLAALIADRYQARAGSRTISTACSAAAQAIGEGMRWIRSGRCDVAIVGGADSLAGELLLAGFCLLGVLSKGEKGPQAASRPFDKDRDGFVASEGAAVLVLESASHAAKRGARCRAELAGYAETENAYRITDLPADGRGAISAMHLAMTDAGLQPQDIDYINAHGTSTDQNDRVESAAIFDLFSGEHPNGTPWVSSTKSEIGHLVAAAGGVEAAFTALALEHGQLPPTRNLDNPIRDDVRFVAHQARAMEAQAALSNSFGFGGTNVTLAMRRAGGPL